MEAIVARVRLVLRLLAGLVALLVYVWVAGVRALPEAKRRRAASRARWAARWKRRTNSS